MKDFDMRVAFPTNDRNQVEEHFGHAKEFAFANVKGGKILSMEYLTPPPHEPGVIPKFVGEKGATAIITGGMGGGTATGAIPYMASVARELNKPLVAVVTTPFGFEGNKRMQLANTGLDELMQQADAVDGKI